MPDVATVLLMIALALYMGATQARLRMLDDRVKALEAEEPNNA